MASSSLVITRIIPSLMIIIGTGMAYIWTSDIVSGRFSDRGSFFQWKEEKTLLWPHIIAEYLTATGLIAGGIGLFVSGGWALPVSLLALGAVIYSAVNSTGWVLAEKNRLTYGIPIWISLVIAVCSAIILVI